MEARGGMSDKGDDGLWGVLIIGLLILLIVVVLA